MKQLSRVVWSEGMYLGPHHFQLQSRYFEDSIRFSTSSLWFEAWGLVGCRLDHEALQNGTVAVLHARGIMPDGMTFSMDECDPLPAARPIGELFPRSGVGMTVMLALPARRQDGLNCVLPGSVTAQDAAARYTASAETMHDETTGRDEKAVYLGRKNFRLLFSTEDATGLITLPIGRVIREGSGRYVFDPSFIPPCLEISASDRLLELIGRLVEILEAKSGTFFRRKSTWVETASREIGAFWLTHTINSTLAPLRHMYFTKHGHPEEVFTELLRLGGALCTFAIDSHPRTLPLYDHLSLSERFAELDYHIRSHLEIIIPSQYIEINLVKRAEYFFEAELTDQRVLNRSRWLFGVRSKIGEAETIANTTRLVKMCSKEFVPRLVQQALPGMAMTHLPVAPSAIPAKVDYQYFSVTQAGPCWEHLVKTRKLGLYVPGEIPDPDLELLVIVDS